MGAGIKVEFFTDSACTTADESSGFETVTYDAAMVEGLNVECVEGNPDGVDEVVAYAATCDTDGMHGHYYSDAECATEVASADCVWEPALRSLLMPATSR